MMNLKHKEYLYRKTDTALLSTYVKRLANSQEGAAVATYRKIEEDNSYLPTILW